MIKHAVYVLNKRLKNKAGLGCPKIQLLERRFSTLRLKERWQEGNESSGHNINAFAEYDWIVKALPTPDKTEEEKKAVFENTKHYQDNWKKYSKSVF